MAVGEEVGAKDGTVGAATEGVSVGAVVGFAVTMVGDEVGDKDGAVGAAMEGATVGGGTSGVVE